MPCGQGGPTQHDKSSPLRFPLENKRQRGYNSNTVRLSLCGCSHHPRRLRGVAAPLGHRLICFSSGILRILLFLPCVGKPFFHFSDLAAPLLPAGPLFDWRHLLLPSCQIDARPPWQVLYFQTFFGKPCRRLAELPSTVHRDFSCRFAGLGGLGRYSLRQDTLLIIKKRRFLSILCNIVIAFFSVIKYNHAVTVNLANIK